jgi:hypothetical protein
MANALQPTTKKAFLDGALDLTSVDVKAYLLDNTYTYSSAHDFVDDFATAVVATSPALTGKTTTGGVFDSSDTTFTAVSGNQVVALALAHDSGTPGTSRFIAFYDTGLTGFPITPNGGDINLAVHASGWFAL